MIIKKIFLALSIMLVSACSFFAPAAVEPTASISSPTATAAPATPTAASPTETPIPPTEIPTPTITPQPQIYGPANFPAGINPLTGLAVSNADLLKRRPLATKIELFPRLHRPTWGASLADIVFDYYQNNGLTRLHAIFYGADAEQIGPIRSARLLDVHLIRMYKSIFAFGGADKRVLNNLFNSEFYDRLVVEGAQNCPPMCRVDPNGANLLVSSTKDLTAYAATKGINNDPQNLDGMLFDYNVPANGRPGNQLSVRFSISAYLRWDYDSASGRYLRYQDTVEDQGGGESYEPFLDRITGQQVAVDNVVVLLIPHAYVYKSGNSEIIDIQLSGSGTAYAFRNGQAYEVRWNRPKTDSVVYLTYPDGRPFPYKHGTTWYELVGTTSAMEIRENGAWRFVFSIP